MSDAHRSSIKVFRQVIFFFVVLVFVRCVQQNENDVCDGHVEGLCTGTTVCFHIHNMIPVSDPEDALKTLEMENGKLFQHLPGFARIGHCRHIDHSQELEGEFQIGQSRWNAADTLPMRQVTSRSASLSEEMMLPR